MAAAKNVRWKCPTCGNGLLAPSKPRMNDVRRYCLPCSAKSGILVQRVAPALERKRAASRQQATAKRAATRLRAQQERTVAGMDVEKEARRLWRILCKQNGKQRRMPPLKIVRRNRAGSSGYCYYGSHISLQLGTDTVAAWETLAHELNHAIGYENHDHRFYRSLKQLTEARWKMRVSSFSWNRAGYDCDHDLRMQLYAAGVVKF